MDTCDHQPFIAKAPLVLIFCADCKKWYDAFTEAGSEPRKPDVGDLMLAVSDAVIAAQDSCCGGRKVLALVPAISEILSKIVRSSADCYSCRNMCFRRQCLCLDGRRSSRMQRPKPQRVDQKYIVHENTYRSMDGNELREICLRDTAITDTLKIG